MKNIKTARRYASALMKIAVKEDRLGSIHADLKSIHFLIENQPEFAGFLINPLIKNNEKRQIFSAMLKNAVSQETLDFLFLLCDKRRENILDEIIEAFISLYDEHIGEVNVEVISVTDLTEDQIVLLTGRLKTMTGRKPNLTFSKDPSLIAGFMVKVGDTVVDGTVRHQLHKLRERLLEKHIF